MTTKSGQRWDPYPPKSLQFVLVSWISLALARGFGPLDPWLGVQNLAWGFGPLDSWLGGSDPSIFGSGVPTLDP